MKPNDSDSQPTKRGPNFQRNLRPPTSKRVTFALGKEAQEQADRIARILSTYKEGGVSRSAVIRGLLQFAETIALESGDKSAKSVFEHTNASGSASPLKLAKTNQDSAMLWMQLRTSILES